ncbi:FG-GAP-like repeat-containing protein, partial [Labrys sp. KB_33_2]|uniref:FG-GAP-like repeat-containing protein n=1 Tax=Labrys sp. KB_33_2 TaxID=3237479 RepID=UPI003F921A22
AFNLEATSGAAKLSQATGKSIATLDRRLASIGITTANNRVRGYNLDYELSPASGTSRLTAVTQFGRDASLSQNRLSGGTSLPPTTFGWSGAPITEQAWTKSNNPTFKYDYVPPLPPPLSNPKSGYSESFGDINSDGIPDKNVSSWVDREQSGGFQDPTITHTRCYSSAFYETASRTRAARTTTFGGGCEYTDANPPLGSTTVTTGSSVGDLSGDGRPDYTTNTNIVSRRSGFRGEIITTTTSQTLLSVSQPDGSYNARLLASRNSEFTTPDLYSSFAIGELLDLDGDGIKEFYYTAKKPAGAVFEGIYRLNGSDVPPPLTRAQLSQMIAGRTVAGPRYVDLNGDGKADYYIIIELNGTIRVSYAYSTGAGFTPLQTFELTGALIANPIPSNPNSTWGYWPAYNAATVLTADVNGDGKTDLVTLEKNPTSGIDIGVFLSTGNGFVHQVWARGITITGSCETAGSPLLAGACMPYVFAGDFDGDGRQDLVINTTTSPNPPPADVPNSVSTMFLSRSGVGSNGEDGFVVVPGQLPSVAAVADLDEDGRDDLIEGAWRSPAGRSQGFIVYRSGDYFTLSTAFPDLLTSVKGPLGASAAIAYKPSSTYPWLAVRPAGSVPPSILQTVSSVTRDDGRGTVGTTDYSYSNALYNAAERRFLGFGMGVALLPANAGETVRPRIDYTFDQSLATAGKVLKTAYSTQDSSTVLAREAETWSVMTTAGLQANWPPASGTVPALTLPYTAFNTGSEKQEIVAGVTRRSTVARTYDAYGNVTLLLENGNADVTGDERLTGTDYPVNAGAFITSLPGRVRVHGGSSPTDVLLSDTVLLYDGAGDAATPPVKGDQTGQWNWLNPGNRWLTTSASYDGYGNKVSSTDGLGNRTETLYDPTYHLFPVEERNPLYVQNGDTRQKTQPITDPVCQTLTGMIDLNGQTTSYGYDGLCRITSVTQPLGA